MTVEYRIYIYELSFVVIIVVVVIEMIYQGINVGSSILLSVVSLLFTRCGISVSHIIICWPFVYW